MKKKVLSVFIAMLIITGVCLCLCISASANGRVARIWIKDIVEPVAGATPEYTFALDTSTYSAQVSIEPYSYKPEGWKNGVQWYDMTDNCIVGYDDTFKAGHQYSVMLQCCATNDLTFEDYDVSVKINGTTDGCYCVEYYNGDNSVNKLHCYVYREFPEVEDTSHTISTVAIEPDFEFRVLDLLDFNPSDYLMMGDGKHIDRTYNKDGFINGIKWVDGNGKVLTKTDRFKSGMDYYLSFRVAADKGYTFANSVNAMVNYNEASVVDCDSDYIVMEYYVYGLGCYGEGWVKTNDGKYCYFYDDSNHYYRNKLVKIAVKGKNYFYYFDSNGFRTTGFQKIKRGDGKVYYHYFKSNGTLVFGWQKIKRGDGKTYLHNFGTNGCMKTGWQWIANSKGVKYKYYFGTNGCMRTGWQWIANSKGVKYRYYFGTNGYMRTGWQKIQASNGKTYKYYFFSNGVNAINRSVKIGSKTYKFNKYGICTNA